jgi:hypothetical protein
MNLRYRQISWRRFLLCAAAFWVPVMYASLSASTAFAVVFGDSVAQWSATGTQGENNWFYGYYDARADVTTGNGVYDAGDVIPFLNDGSNVVSVDPTIGGWKTHPNHWNGSAWDLLNQGAPGANHGPWTEMGSGGGHPAANAQLDPEVHWLVRRWESTTAGAVHIHGSHDTPAPCGDGTSRRIFHNGVPIHSGVSQGAPVTYNVGRTIAVGDTIDFIIDPNGSAAATDINLVNDGCDSTSFSMIIDDTPVPPPPPPPPMALADSNDDWSTTGTLGERNWFNGYYNLTGDPDGTFSAGDFQPFANDGTNSIGPDGANHWDGTGFRLYRSTGPDTGPWTSLYRLDTHPNGTNSLPPREVPGAIQEEHWTIRRWEADVSTTTPVAIKWSVEKQNIGGDGTEGRLFINGVQVDSMPVDGAGPGINRTYYANINPFDVIDLALTPVSPGNNRGDGADGSRSRLRIENNPPPGPLFNPPLVPHADSAAQFSGNQGQDNWFYGYYDRTADLGAGGDGAYQAVTEFTPFEGGDGGGPWGDEQHWTGSAWDINPDGASTGNPPWTYIDAFQMHPNDNNPGPEHHAIKRWVSDVTGDYVLDGYFNNGSTGGDGTTGRILLNGTEIFAQVTDGTTGYFQLMVDLNEGDFIDFLVDTVNPADDGSDGTFFRAKIYAPEAFVPIPEPSTYVLAGIGLLLAGWLARRKGG